MKNTAQIVSATNLESKLKVLMLEALQGNSVSYHEFLSQVDSLLRKYVTKLTWKAPVKLEAQDIVQDVLLTIHQKRHLYNKELQILPWIYTIAKHRFIDLLRSSARKKEHIEFIDMYSNSTAIEDEISTLWGEDSGLDLLHGLNKKQKDILWLAKVEEMPLIEIAKKTDTSHSLVKVTVHRALKTLRGQIQNK